MAARDRADHGRDLGLVGDVQPAGLALPDLGRDPLGGREVDVGDRDMGAGLGQRPTGRPPDPIAAAGDQCHAPSSSRSLPRKSVMPPSRLRQPIGRAGRQLAVERDQAEARPLRQPEIAGVIGGQAAAFGQAENSSCSTSTRATSSRSSIPNAATKASRRSGCRRIFLRQALAISKGKSAGSDQVRGSQPLGDRFAFRLAKQQGGQSGRIHDLSGHPDPPDHGGRLGWGRQPQLPHPGKDLAGVSRREVPAASSRIAISSPCNDR